MAVEAEDGREKALNEIGSARRAAMLKFAIEQEEGNHYSEALDIYRQLIQEYTGTEEEVEARERMLDLAHLFGSEKQTYRMLSLYGTLEGLYAHERHETRAGARRARVREILDDIHERELKEAEDQAKLEAMRKGLGLPTKPEE